MKNKKKLLILMPFLLIIFLGISYAAFTYINSIGNNEFVMGDLRFNYYDVSPNIKKTKVFPESKEEARDPSLHPTNSVTIDGYDYSYQDNELIFKVDCISPLDDFYYSIGVTEGDSIEGKIRLDPKFIRLDFYEIDPSTHEETPILENYSLLNNYFDEVLKVDQISTEEIRLYRIRFWYEDSVLISNSVPEADYTATEFSNGYYSVKMHIDASFDQHYYDYSYMRRYSSSDFWPAHINNIKTSIKKISFLKLTDQLLDEYYSAPLAYDPTDRNYPNTKEIYVYTRNNNTELVIASESLILFPSDSNHALAGFMIDNSGNSYNYYVDIDITNLDTSLVQDMSYFLADIKNLRNITSSNDNHLKTPKVTTFSNFLKINGWTIHPKFTDESFNYLIKDFDTSNATNMEYMFTALSEVNEVDLRHFDVSKVTNMRYMFSDCKAETINIDGWNTDSLTNMAFMFSGTRSLKNIDLTQLNTKNVTTMDSTFAYTSLKKIDLTLWNTSKVTTMNKMFRETTVQEINLAYIDTSSVRTYSSMFNGCSQLVKINIDGLNIGTNTLASLFKNCSKLEIIDLSKVIISPNITVSSTQHYGDMFYGCTKLKTIYVSENWNFPDTHASAYNMFTGCTSLVGAVPFDSSNITNAMANYTTGYFTLKQYKTIDNIHRYIDQFSDIEKFIITKEKAINKRYLIANLSDEAALYKVGKIAYIIVSGITLMPEDSSYFFAELPNLKTIQGMELLDFSKATNLSHLFDGDSSLVDVETKFIKTNIVNDTSYMFNDCSSLEEINIAGISLVNDGNYNNNINYMFANCRNLERIIADSLDAHTAQASEDNYLYALKDCLKLKVVGNGDLTIGEVLKHNGYDYHNLFTLSRLSYTEMMSVLTNISTVSLIMSTGNVRGDVSMIDFTEPPTEGGFYTYEIGEWVDDEFIPTGETLFARGAYSPSFVFNNFCWKVLSYNMGMDMNTFSLDMYTKLIYFGKVVVVNGKKTCPDSGGYNGNNSISDVPDSLKGFTRTLGTQYLGYMYGSANSSYELATNNAEDSLPKKALEQWYEDNGFEDKEFYIKDVPYCSDRSIATSNITVDGVSYTGNGTGYNDTLTVYAPYERASQNSPSLSCPNINDRFTVSPLIGNGKNKHPIGLMTSDELMLAGGGFKRTGITLYFATVNASNTWTMSPAYYVSSSNAQMMAKTGQNDVNNSSATSWYGLQPVITLNNFRTFIYSGDGSSEHPYLIDEESTRDDGDEYSGILE